MSRPTKWCKKGCGKKVLFQYHVQVAGSLKKVAIYVCKKCHNKGPYEEMVLE